MEGGLQVNETKQAIDDILSMDLGGPTMTTMSNMQTTSTPTSTSHLDTKPSPIIGESRFDAVNRIFYIDNSGIEAITSCPYLAYVELLLRRTINDPQPALTFGGHIHRAMEYTYRMLAHDAHPKIQSIFRLLEWCWSRESTGEDWRTLGMAQEIMRLYFTEYPPATEPNVIIDSKGPFVERSFAVHFGEYNGIIIIYMGKMDVKVRDGNGHFIMDHKTSSVMGLGFWTGQAASEQQRGYCWVDRETTGEEPLGYIINSIATRPPTKTGTSIAFERRKFYTRYPVSQLDEWQRNCFAQIKTFLRYIEDGHFPRHHRHCVHKYGTCFLNSLCNDMNNEGDRMKKLMGPEFRTNVWSPIKK